MERKRENHTSLSMKLTNGGNHHSFNAQLLLRENWFVFLVGRFEIVATPTLAEVLHGPLLFVDAGDDDIAVVSDRGALHQHHIPVENPRSDHGVPLSLQDIRRFWVFDQELVQVDRVPQLLLGRRRETSGHRAQDTNTGERTTGEKRTGLPVFDEVTLLNECPLGYGCQLTNIIAYSG